MTTKLILAATLGLASLLTSCSATSAAPTSAVSCSKCHTIHFNVPVTGGVGAAGAKGGVVTLRHADSMSCPDCQNQVVAMLKTGSLTKHVCPTCGGTLHHCSSH